MMKYILLALIYCLFLSACSVTKLNNTINNEMNNESKVMQIEDQVNIGTIIDDKESENQTNDNNSESESEINPEIQRIDRMNVIIRGVGGSFPGFVKYNEKLHDGTTEEKIRGTEGITYTLNSVTLMPMSAANFLKYSPFL